MLSAFVEHDGARLHYVVSGRSHAPALLLLNSLGGTVEMWAPQLPRLEKLFRVIRFDARGHGRSVLPDGEPATRGIGDYAADALAVLDALRITRAHWCGLSMGGMVAMWAAANRPERVARLVLACTAAWMPPPESWDQRIATVQSAGLAHRRGQCRALVHRGFRHGHAEVVEKILAGVPARSAAVTWRPAARSATWTSARRWRACRAHAGHRRRTRSGHPAGAGRGARSGHPRCRPGHAR
ncbi:MAG: alpha/beta fold hydrolase [Steroidobacteraceae bacterium]